MKEIISIKDNFIKEATPGIGRVMFDINFNASTHLNEINVAMYLKERFGGNIKILQENNIERKFVKQPDYLWNGKYWELKNCTSLKSIDTRTHVAIKQLRDKTNIGGIILKINNIKNTNNEILSKIINRLIYSMNKSLIVIVILNGLLVEIIQHK